MATKLDEFIPEGEPIHPFDFVELLKEAKKVEVISEPIRPEDGDDYLRNRHKLGSVMRVDGKLYFENTAVECKREEDKEWIRNHCPSLKHE